MDPANLWSGNFRDLNAMVTRMATLCDGGRITVKDVNDEIERMREECKVESGECKIDGDQLAKLLGDDYEAKYDRFDLIQLAEVVRVCRESKSMADASLKLYSVSLKAKKSSNNSDRLSKYLAKFGLRFKELG